MTRDEAIKIVHETSRGFVVTDNMAQCLIDTYVGLGMLRLEAPRTKMQRICTVLQDWRGAETEGASAFLSRLEGAGLEVVEK